MATDDRLTLLKQAIAKLKEDGVQSVGVDALVAVAGGDGSEGFCSSCGLSRARDSRPRPTDRPQRNRPSSGRPGVRPAGR